MKKPPQKIPRVVYECVPGDPDEAAAMRQELDRIFDLLFDTILEAESEQPDKALPASKPPIDNSA